MNRRKKAAKRKTILDSES
jgi:hypothetical protein